MSYTTIIDSWCT